MANVDLEDLKQLLQVSLAQSEERLEKRLLKQLEEQFTVRLEERITNKLTAVIYAAVEASENRLRAEMQAGFAAIADIITAMNDRMDKHFADYERRLRRLEKHHLPHA